MDENNDLLLKTNSETFKVELYHAGNEKLTTEAGGINITGHVTASGNISGSASSTGSFGAGFFDDSVGMGVAPGNSNYLLNIEAAQTYAARFKSRKTTSSSSQRTMILVGSGQDKGAGIYFSGPSSTNFSIGFFCNERKNFPLALHSQRPHHALQNQQ